MSSASIPCSAANRGVCFLIVVVLAGVLISSARSDVVLDWTSVMLAAIRLEDSSPTLSTRNLAILHVAMYDAGNSVERRRQPYQFCPEPPLGTTAEGAMFGAAYEVLKTLYPSVKARADDLYGTYAASVANKDILNRSVGFGAEIGRLTLQARANDGSATQVPYVPSGAPGQWRRTPPFFRPPLDPHWRHVRPFCLPALEPFLPPGPPALRSDQYARDLNQVKELGAKNSSARTAEQSQIAVFWSDFSYTAMPPGHWHEIAMTIARTRGNTLAQNARLFALLSLAQADAAIVCWEAKYRYNFWRPITAIHRADEAANPATERDPQWDHYLSAPNFPEYPSGHSTFSKASANVLTSFYGTDTITFLAQSDSLPGVFRRFTSLAECADEVGMSRIYGGIHFMSANRDGKASGGKVADYIMQNFLLPNDQLPRLAFGPLSQAAPRLSVQSHFGSACILEVSSNLVDWRVVWTNAAPQGDCVVHDLQLPVPGFYRLREF